MKRTLLLLSLFAVPGMVTSCKDEAATPAPDNTSSVAEVTKSAPEPAAEVSQTAVFHPDELGQSYGCYDMERICACDDGYQGKMVDLQKLKVGDLLEDFCYGAYEAGRTDLVLQCLEMGMDPNSGIKYAAWLGRMDIIQSLFDQGADDYYWGLEGAARGGHMDIVQLMLNKGATDYNWGLRGAAWGGHMEIVQLMLSKGATDYDLGLYNAAECGHLDIVQLLLSKGATDYNLGLEGAVYSGHMEIVQLMLEKGANPNAGFYSAAILGRAEIIKILLAQPGIDVNQKESSGSTALDEAVDKGHIECIELIRAAGGKRGKEL